jgi:hypothetical protein
MLKDVVMKDLLLLLRGEGWPPLNMLLLLPVLCRGLLALMRRPLASSVPAATS